MRRRTPEFVSEVPVENSDSHANNYGDSQKDILTEVLRSKRICERRSVWRLVKTSYHGSLSLRLEALLATRGSVRMSIRTSSKKLNNICFVRDRDTEPEHYYSQYASNLVGRFMFVQDTRY